MFGQKSPLFLNPALPPEYGAQLQQPRGGFGSVGGALQGANNPGALRAQYQAAQGDLGMADKLLEAGYVPNSGAMGALAMIASAYAGRKIKKGAEEKMSDAVAKMFEMDTQKEKERAAALQAQKEQEYAKELGKIQYKAETEAKYAKNKDPQAIALFKARGEMSPEERAQFDSWDMARKPNGANVEFKMPAQESAFAKEIGKEEAATYNAQRNKAVSSQQALNSIDALDSVLANVSTGKPQEAYGKLAQWVGAPEGAEYQATQALVAERVNEILNAAKGPQTDQDAERARAQIPNIGTDPRARKVVFDYIRKKAKNEVDLFDDMSTHVQKNNSLRGYKPSVGKFNIDTSPLVNSGGGGGSGGKYSVGQIIEVGGKKYRVKTGGDDPDLEQL